MVRILLTIAMLLQVVPAGEPELVLYQPPMGTLVVDSFRPPAHIGAPGNRGLEFGLSEGQGVQVAANGQVIFAGQVAGRGVITLHHPDGVRTTYTGLEDIWVIENGYVLAGELMGVAGGGFHFGARLGDHYLDPQVLIDASQQTSRPRLLPPPG